jgi:hypothetical protein
MGTSRNLVLSLALRIGMNAACAVDVACSIHPHPTAQEKKFFQARVTPHAAPANLIASVVLRIAVPGHAAKLVDRSCDLGMAHA